jgi:phage replication O-like protein O
MEQNYSQHGNGYTKINNNVLREAYRSPFNATQIRIILAVIRMTCGWNKESKIISYGYLAREANLDKRNVRRAINLLVQAKVIIKNKTGRKNMLGINQVHTSWELWKTHGTKRAKPPLHEG